jgi:hypothetical protein
VYSIDIGIYLLGGRDALALAFSQLFTADGPASGPGTA